MKQVFPIATFFIGILSADLAVASTIAKAGTLRGLKLQSRKTLEPSPPDEQGTEEPTRGRTQGGENSEGMTWIRVTNVARLFPDKSSIPVATQYFFATLWVLMIAAIPFVLPSIDAKPVTPTQKIVGASMLVVLFGGLYLFTNIIYFQSVHFERVRPLTMVEVIYFMSQVITTVGYGDITPAKTRGQVFVALYVLGALFVIAMLVSQVTDHFAEILHRQREKMWGSTPRGDSLKATMTVHDLLEPEKPSAKSLIWGVVAFLIIDISWVAFFSNFPGENKAMWEAFYMSLVTLTTVGFGAVTPLTEEGMIFAAFFMIIGSASVVNVIGQFCQFVAEMNEFQRFSTEVKMGAVDDLKYIVKDNSKVTEFEFFQFIVQYENVMTEAEVLGIRAVFGRLDTENQGSVDFEMIVRAIEVDRSRSQYFDDDIPKRRRSSRHR